MANTLGNSKGFGLKTGPKMGLFGASWRALLRALLSPYIGKYTLSYVQMAQGLAGRGLKIGLWEAYLGPYLGLF